MPVRNLAPYVRDSVESILTQSFRDFEFIIRDDGSTDGTAEILRTLAGTDSRIALHEGSESLGPSGSSNWVATRARGALIARMDGDDWSHPNRLARQIDVLDAHRDAVLVGSLCETMNEHGKVVRQPERWRLTANSAFSPFPHGSVMLRREALRAVGGYRDCADYWEDLDLYRRLAPMGRLLIIPEALYRHRATALSTRLVSSSAAVEASVDRMYRTMAGKPPATGGRLAPRVFLSLGSTMLWAGGRPSILRSLVQRADLRPDLESALVILWALWAKLSPASLRFALRWLSGARNRRAARRSLAQSLYSWIVPALESKVAITASAAEQTPQGPANVQVSGVCLPAQQEDSPARAA